MKRLRPRYELVRHQALLLVGEEGAVFKHDLFPEFVETRFHQVGGGLVVDVMHGEFVKFAAEEAALDGSGRGFGEKALASFDLENFQVRLIARQGEDDVERQAVGPSQELFGGVAPMQAEGRLQEVLCGDGCKGQKEGRGHACPSLKAPAHASKLAFFRPLRKERSMRRGTLLFEAMLALSILTCLGLVLLKLSLNVVHPRQWVMQQTLTDAYLTYERALAERVPFSDLIDNNSLWPVFPTVSTTAVDEIGILPGNVALRGNVMRTRIADTNNYVIDGGTGTLTTNPAAMKVWKVQSVLTYTVGNRTYAKSRTVIRSQ